MGKDGERFGRGEAGADADSGTASERQILKTMPFGLCLGGETSRIEPVRIVPQFAMAMEQPGPDRNDVARAHLMLPEPVRLDCLSVEARRRGLESKGLLDDPPKQGQPIGQRRIFRPRRQRLLRLGRRLSLKLPLLAVCRNSPSHTVLVASPMARQPKVVSRVLAR